MDSFQSMMDLLNEASIVVPILVAFLVFLRNPRLTGKPKSKVISKVIARSSSSESQRSVDALVACSQRGDWETAVRILEEVDTPTCFMFNVCIKACVQADGVQSEEALKLFSRMKSLGVTPDFVTYNTLVQALCKAARLDEAIEVLEEAKRFGFGYDAASYGCLVLLSASEGRTDQALEFLNTMLTRDMKPSFNNFRAVLFECCRAGRAEEATEIALAMRKHGFSFARSVKRTIECSIDNNRHWQPLLRVVSDA